MPKLNVTPWRALFLAAGIAIVVGGPRHPDGTMVEMLAHPDWVLSHTLVLVGMIGTLGGLVLYRRAHVLPEATARWARLAVIGAALQVVDMAVHTASVVDGANLAAGRGTPVLTVHLVLTVIVYPIFAATLIGFIVAAARERALGSWWIAPFGVLGLAAHGLAALLVVALQIEGAAILFPGIVLFALWMLIAAFWPVRVPATAEPRLATATA